MIRILDKERALLTLEQLGFSKKMFAQFTELITKPHGNPQLNHLIELNRESPQARSLSALTAAVLRPKNPRHAQFKTAGDILRGIRRIEAKHEPAAA